VTSGDNTDAPRGGETAIEVGLRHRQEGESRRKRQLPDTDRPQRLGAKALPGSESRANAQQDYPGTWETMSSPPCGKTRAVLQNEGTTEVTREGRRGVIVAHTTGEAGEVAQATLWRTKGPPSHGTIWRNDGRDTGL
jgi:hypothetical protein